MYKILKLNNFRQFNNMDIFLGRRLTVVADTFNMEKKDVKQLIMNGVEAAFTTEGIKNRLRARVETQFAKVAGIRG